MQDLEIRKHRWYCLVVKNDIIELMEACIDGTLDQIDLQFEDNAAVCVVLASDGYPVKYEKGLEIKGLEEFDQHEGYYCFHAGTCKRTETVLNKRRSSAWSYCEGKKI